MTFPWQREPWCWFNWSWAWMVLVPCSPRWFLYFLICCLIQILLRWIELRLGKKNLWTQLHLLSSRLSCREEQDCSVHSHFLKLFHVSHMPARNQITESSGFQKDLLFWSQHPESWVTCLDNSLLFEVYLNKAYMTSWFLFSPSQNCHMTTTNTIISPVGFIHQDFGDKQHLWMKKEAK